jgi:hypothetical protein
MTPNRNRPRRSRIRALRDMFHRICGVQVNRKMFQPKIVTIVWANEKKNFFFRFVARKKIRIEFVYRKVAGFFYEFEGIYD